jgi:hypothetical protein
VNRQPRATARSRLPFGGGKRFIKPLLFQQQGKLLAAQPPHEGALGRCFMRHRADGAIAHVMAVEVVHALEMVDVEENRR